MRLEYVKPKHSADTQPLEETAYFEILTYKQETVSSH